MKSKIMKVVIRLQSKTTSYRALLGQREYLKLIAANVVNRFGDSVDSIAYSLLIYRVTGSAALMALVLAVNYLPTILLQPIAGALVDRLNKQRVMVLTDLGRGLVVAGTAAVMLWGELTTPVILLSVVANSTLEALRVPAGVAVVPFLLDEDKYTVGAAANQAAGQVCVVAGLALAGPIVEGLGMAAALFIDAGTFLLSALGVACIRAEGARRPAAEGKADLRGVARGLRDGLAYIRADRRLWALILLGMCLNVIGTPLNVFYTPYITDWLGGGASLLGGTQLAMVAGAALGSALTPKLSRFGNRRLILACGFASALAYVGMAFVPLAPDFPLRAGLILAIMLVTGVFGGMLNVVFSALFMACVDREYLGRTSGVTNALLTLAMPLISLLCAGLAACMTLPWVLLAAGLLTALVFAAVACIRVYREM